MDGFADGAADHSLDDAANDAQISAPVVDQPLPVTVPGTSMDDESGNCADEQFPGYAGVGLGRQVRRRALSVNSTAPGVYSPLTRPLDVGTANNLFDVVALPSAADTSARALSLGLRGRADEPQI